MIKRIKNRDHYSKDFFRHDNLYGLQNLLNLKVYHHDIKPDNMFYFEEENVIRLADFGISKIDKESSREST